MISILMPVFNAAPFLRECLQSILQQTADNWELLAVNDFSTDDSRIILEHFAAKDQRIKVFQNTEKGIIPALRLAYEQSSGAFITRMDADDIMPRDKLMLLRELLIEAGPGHLATGYVQYFSEQTLGDGYQKYEQWLNGLAKNASNFSEIYKECVIPSPAWMIHREDLDRCGAFAPDLYPEDYDLVFRFYKNGLKVVACSELVHLWRDHPGRSSRNDPNYANQQYFELKLPYFLELDHNPKQELVLWGAGKKGKQIARMLSEQLIDFQWICNTESKWGTVVYGQKLRPVKILDQLTDPQIIIAVAGPDDQKEILDIVEKRNWIKGKNYYFFC